MNRLSEHLGSILRISNARVVTAVLGLGAAAIGISDAVVSSDLTQSAGFAFLLAASSLCALIAMSRVKNHREIFHANVAIWIALGAFLSNQQPILGILFVAAAVASTVWVARAKELGTPMFAAALSVSPVEEIPAKDRIILSNNGQILLAGNLGTLKLKQAERLLDRIHIGDRVTFLRSLSAIKSEKSACENLTLLVNNAAADVPPRFETLEIAMKRSSSGDISMELVQNEAVESSKSPEQARNTNVTNMNVLAIVSHELRTPLNAIIGFSDLLQSDIGKALPSTRRDEYAELINGAGKHLLALVNTILDVSKIEAGSYTIHRDDFCFATAVSESVALVREQAEKKNISVNKRFLPSLERVYADRRAVKQMLINLLTNAVKYTENGGFITIDACFDAGTFTFEISDTGIGMTAHELAQIGTPFSQVDSALNRTNEGTGLGLSLVKGLVDLHDGKMSIHSMPNIGTRVCVSIPNDCKKANTTNKTNSKLVTLT